MTRRTSCLLPIGFSACMIGLFLWTLDQQVLWAIGGFAVLLLCWARSDKTEDDRNE